MIIEKQVDFMRNDPIGTSGHYCIFRCNQAIIMPFEESIRDWSMKSALDGWGDVAGVQSANEEDNSVYRKKVYNFSELLTDNWTDVGDPISSLFSF